MEGFYLGRSHMCVMVPCLYPVFPSVLLPNNLISPVALLVKVNIEL